MQVMSRVFFRKRLLYNESLSALLPSLIEFWQEEDPHFPRHKRVLLKPNLLSPHPPDKAITTHPLLVSSLASILTEFGNRVFIADSPAGSHNRHIRKLWDVTGMSEAARICGAELININERGLVERKGITRNFYFTDLLEETDYILNLPKLKTHGLTLITASLKNIFGLIPGIQKGEYHIRYPSPLAFSENMVEIFAAIKPHFTIMDAIEILEGNGPSSGGNKRYAGWILAGKDAVAVDSIAARCLRIDPHSVDMIRLAGDWGLGESHPQRISLVGDSLSQLQIELPSPHIFSRLPGVVHALLKKLIWTRPRANGEKCTRCGICISNCPAEAMSPNWDKIPEIDYQKCIHCFCCAEVCPDDAIFQETSWLVKKLS
ncbi:MAG: DUF362 domain-containing protein [Calditrichia bacterium]